MLYSKGQILLFLPQKLQSIFLVEKQVFFNCYCFVINIVPKVTMRFCPPPPLLPSLLTEERHDELYREWMGRVARFYANEHRSGGASHDSSDKEVNLFGDIPRPERRSNRVESKITSIPVSGGVKKSYAAACSSGGPSPSNGGSFENPSDVAMGKGAVSSVGGTKLVPLNEEEWLDPIHHVNRMKSIRSAYSKKWCPGSLAGTRTPDVSTVLPDDKEEDDSRNVRDKVYGIVLKQSSMDKDTWLLRFYNKKIFYLHINLLSFEKSAATDLDFLLKEEIKLMKQ